MKTKPIILILLTLLLLLAGCSSKNTSNTNPNNFEYPSLEDIHNVNLEQDEQAHNSNSYGSIDEVRDANADGFPLYILRSGRFYPLECVNDRVRFFPLEYRTDGQYGEACATFIMRDPENLPAINLSNGDQLVSISDLRAKIADLYPAHFTDFCAPVYFDYSQGLSIDTNVIDYEHDRHAAFRLSEISGKEIELPSYPTQEDFLSAVSGVLRASGLRPTEIRMRNQSLHSASVIVCGEYGDSFNAGGYRDVEYREFNGVIDHCFYTATSEISVINLLELTKDGYAVINLSNIESGVYFINYSNDIYAVIANN